MGKRLRQCARGRTETCRFVGRRVHHVRPAARRGELSAEGKADSSGGGGGGGYGQKGEGKTELGRGGGTSEGSELLIM